MNDRIKLIRKNSGLTQSEFGEKIGIKQNTIATYEMGKVTPSDVAINNICKEFNVNEKWLRTGEGEPYIEMSKKERIARFLGEVMADEEESFRVRFFEALASYTPEDWRALERILSITSTMINKDKDGNKD
ncbi:MAG: helix-turn-helix domain-containing protein [Candidatus Cryptobacteroides sp.]